MARSHSLLIAALLAAFLLLAFVFGAGRMAQAAADDAPDLAIISELTGLSATLEPFGPECAFSQEYQVYLCPEPEPAGWPVPDPAARAAALRLLTTSGLLLVPESSNDRVMAFDPVTGNLVDANFIPADPTNLSTPIHAIAAADGGGVLVSDQLDDVVQYYDLDGNYVGVFAPAGGANTAILDNIRGISLRPNGNLLVTVGSGSNADSVAEFDGGGVSLGNFVAIGAGGLDSPFDVFGRAADWLVGGITSDAIHRYDLSGNPLANLASIDTFPEQLYETAGGNVLVGNFSGTQEGVVEYTSAGALVGIYDPANLGGYRGAYELPNGNILTTNGSGVHEISRAGALVETKISGVSARFIEHVQAAMAMTQTVQVGSSGCGAGQSINATLGAPVTFCYTMSNVGDFSLVTHNVTDTVNGPLLTNFVLPVSPTLSVWFTATYTPTAAGMINNCADWAASNSSFSLTEQSCTTVTVAAPTDVSLSDFGGESAGRRPTFWLAVLAASLTMAIVWRVRRGAGQRLIG